MSARKFDRDLLRIPPTLETVPNPDDSLRLKRMAITVWMIAEKIAPWCKPQKRLIEDQDDYRPIG